VYKIEIASQIRVKTARRAHPKVAIITDLSMSIKKMMAQEDIAELLNILKLVRKLRKKRRLHCSSSSSKSTLPLSNMSLSQSTHILGHYQRIRGLVGCLRASTRSPTSTSWQNPYSQKT